MVLDGIAVALEYVLLQHAGGGGWSDNRANALYHGLCNNQSVNQKQLCRTEAIALKGEQIDAVSRVKCRVVKGMDGSFVLNQELYQMVNWQHRDCT